ncbi:MAG: MaoC/PaaZ C-terminal domain-containing protein [Polyangia bacterium]
MSESARGMYFDGFEPGKRWETGERTVGVEDIEAFAELSGDFNPIHDRRRFNAEQPLGGSVAHGLLGAAIGSGLTHELGILDGTTVALLEQSLRFIAPLRAGDTVRRRLEVRERRATKRDDRGVVVFFHELVNQRGETVIEGEMCCLIEKGANRDEETRG